MKSCYELISFESPDTGTKKSWMECVGGGKEIQKKRALQ